MRMTFFTCHFNCPPLLTRSGDEDSRSNDATHVRTRIPRIRSSSRGSSSTCRWMIDRSILVDRSDSMQRIQSSRFESQFYTDRGEINVIVMIFAPSLSPCLSLSLSLPIHCFVATTNHRASSLLGNVTPKNIFHLLQLSSISALEYTAS